MNRYKIDRNDYVTVEYPYALYVKRGWWGKWQYIASFKTKDQARDLYYKLSGLPIHLGE